MIKFGIGNTIMEYYDFAKHHKRMAIHVARTYSDGTKKDYIKSDTLREDIASNPDKVFTKKRNVYTRDLDKVDLVEETFVWLENRDYEIGDLEYYSTGASNTKQTTHVRLKFQFEYGRAFLDYKFNTSGSYATPFSSLCGHGFIGSIIDEIIDDSTLKDDGIVRDENGVITMILTDENGEPVDCELQMHEIEDAFIGIEIYKFEQEIVDNLLLDEDNEDDEEAEEA